MRVAAHPAHGARWPPRHGRYRVHGMPGHGPGAPRPL